jgi:formylglycine-generating enzyme required for sulfatase activity
MFGKVLALGSLTLGCNKTPEPSQQDSTRQKTGVDSKTQEPPKEQTVDLGGGVMLDLVLIPAGSFTMGNAIVASEKPARKVTITKPFYLGKFEVTQEQWEAVMGNNPSEFKGPKNPVEQVSWTDCQEFLVKLNAKAGGQGGKFVLPTEAQWEYACRAGSTGEFCFGNKEKQLGEYAWWYDENSGIETHPVGEKKPNAWGLYDMHGNVCEWCQDWYGTYGAEAVDDPSGPTKGTSRVYRGGGWLDFAWLCNVWEWCQDWWYGTYGAEAVDDPSGPTKGTSRVYRDGSWLDSVSLGCRSASRDRDTPEFRDDYLGFRVSQVPAD